MIKRSVFIGHAAPANTKEEAMRFVGDVRSHHKDANHNAFAYLINDGRNFAIRYDDDGEPKGSAGKPILKVIQNKDISNVVVVVTRYFGGVKLGYGGLIRAYGETASKAINDAGVGEVYETERFEVTFPYDLFHVVKETIERGHGRIAREEYGGMVKFTVEARKGEAKNLMELLTEYTKGRVRLRKLFMSPFEKGI